MGNLTKNHFYTKRRDLYINADDILINTTEDTIKTLLMRAMNDGDQGINGINDINGIKDINDINGIKDINDIKSSLYAAFLADKNQNQFFNNIMENDIIEDYCGNKDAFKVDFYRDSKTKNLNVKITNHLLNNKDMIKVIRSGIGYKDNISYTMLMSELFSDKVTKKNKNDIVKNESVKNESIKYGDVLNKDVLKRFNVKIIVNGMTEPEVNNKIDVIVDFLDRHGYRDNKGKHVEIIPFITNDGETPSDKKYIDMTGAIYIDKNYDSIDKSNADIKILYTEGKDTDYNGGYRETDIDNLYKVSKMGDIVSIVNFASEYQL